MLEMPQDSPMHISPAEHLFKYMVGPMGPFVKSGRQRLTPTRC
jgi:hypothetical protein